jgi:hypothetical protein
MSNPDFEQDQDFGPMSMADAPQGYVVNRDESDQPFLNAEKADEFDPKILDDVEGLVYLGYLTSDVDIFGHQFTIKTLTRGERLACALLVKDYDESFGIGDALETVYVAACILMLDGRPLSASLSPEERDPTQRIRTNFNRVQKWYDPVIEAVYAEYGRLLVRQAQAFGELDLKSPASLPQP